MTDQQPAFDPGRYLRKLQGGEYLDVKWRLLWLRTDHPEASIVTEAHSITDQLAIFRAVVTLPSGAQATGYGSEQPKDFRDYIEKAETKAIGRALSALGYGTQFATDHEDGAGNGRPADAPVRATNEPELSPEQQRNKAQAAVFAAGKDKHLVPEDVKLIAYQKYGVGSLTDLTMEQLRDYWRYLNDTGADDLLEAAKAAHDHAATKPDKPTSKAKSADDGEALFNRAP